MDRSTQSLKAAALRQLHLGPEILVLVNAWDAASAALIAKCGSKAIATASAGVAFALGYPDGEQIPRDEMLAQVRRIARVVDLPVTADLEAGYAVDPGGVAETARELIATGAVGLNLEDAVDGSLLDRDLQVARIQAVREVGHSMGVPIVINARTDVFLCKDGGSERLEDAIDRGGAYRAAGADCLFVPGVSDRNQIAALVQGIDGPLNVLASAGTPSIPELAQLGVRRVSFGSGAMRASLWRARSIADQLLRQGSYSCFLDSTIPFREMNELFS
jgi:2-methylisocitrate lyase-like PEP mutase family enzyme